MTEKAVNALKQAGATASEQEKLNYMIKALSQNYKHIGDLIAVIPERERIVDNLKSKIKLKCIDEKPKIESTRSNVFKVQSTEKKAFCYNCGKPNHKKKDLETIQITQRQSIFL